MAELKTQRNQASVGAFVDAIEDPARRADCRELVRLMGEITGDQPAMWGSSIVGFGTYHYRYGSGREGDWFVTGFSPRKNDLTLYIMGGFEPHGELMAKLGKHKCGKSCLYVKGLEAIDRGVLEQLIRASIAHVRSVYG